jgi:hypothetical protein
MYARLSYAAAVAVGIGLIVMTLSLSLFGRAAAGERITDTFRSTVAPRGFTQLAHSYGEIRGLGTQLNSRAVPFLTAELGVTPARFRAKLERDFPATARAVREGPPAIALVDPVIPQLVGVRSDFHRVDRIPGLGLPITVLPWVLVGLGAALAALGAAGLAGRRGALPALAFTGLAMVAVPLALGLPGKLAAGPHLVDVGHASLSQQAADTATRTVQNIDAMVPEVQYSLIPAVAARTHQTPLALTRKLAAASPAVVRGLRDWPGLREGAVTLAANQEATVDDLSRLDGTPFRGLTWFVLVPGAVLALLAVGTLAGAGERRRHLAAAHG